MQRRRLKFLIGGGVIILAIVYLIVSGSKGAMVYYVTIDELHTKPVYDKKIRVLGKVVDGSIQRNNLDIMFAIAEGGRRIPVTYHGIVPDTFKDGSDAVVEGRYRMDGTFTAETVMAKCPSKYEGKTYEEHQKAMGEKPM
jgi:cytochrome c-type biogenesis protein CcmE